MMFYSSKDARAFGAPIIRLLVTALGRIPGEADLAPLVARFRAGEGLAELAVLVALSDEFLARHGPAGPADMHYARTLYWAVDGQDPPPQTAPDVDMARISRASLLHDVSTCARAVRGIDLIANLYPDGLPPGDDVAYQLWLEAYRQDPDNWAAAAATATLLPARLFTLYLHVSSIRPDLVEETIASLAAQLWPHWECILLCADLPARTQAVVEALAARVAGVRIAAMPDQAAFAATVNQHLASSEATMFAIIETGDRLAPHALAEAARLMAAQPQTVLIYTDEDRISGDGTRREPSLKPDYSLDLSFAGDSFGQLALFDRDAALRAGGLGAAAGGFMRYELALRLARNTAPANIRHIAKILFHRSRLKAAEQRLFPALRSVPGTNDLAGIVTRHLAENYPGLSLGTHWQANACWPVVSAALPTPAPRVSVIIPMRDRPGLAERCLDGLMNGTDYPDIEIIIVDNGSVETATMQFLQRVRHDPRIRVLPSAGRFNWSALNNQAAGVATGEILLFLNNDIEIADPAWLRLIAGHVMRPDIGVVGARLVFADGSLQHGGILLGPAGAAVHACTYSRNTGGYLGQVALGRDMSAVSGACLAVRADTLARVGGFREQLVVTWGDVDLCLRVRELGLRVLWLAAATLIHHEMSTRGSDTAPQAQIRHEQERAIARRRNYAAMEYDPFLNPNLEATATSIMLAAPPRAPADAPDRTHADG